MMRLMLFVFLIYILSTPFSFSLNDDVEPIIPNDKEFDLQWGIYNSANPEIGSNAKLGADAQIAKAWNITQGSSTVVVAILDSGVKLDHPELEGRIWQNDTEIPNDGIDNDFNGLIDDYQGWDFVNGDNDPTDDRGHGTRVTGIIGANANNDLGFAGVDWNCKLMILKVTDINGATTPDLIAEAIDYAVENGAHVINMSLAGTSIVSSKLETSVANAHVQGVVMVAGAGNSGLEEVTYPAGYDEVIAVAATNPQDKLYTANTYGDFIDVVAPGVKIYVLDHEKDNRFNNVLNGTSYAAPYVSGVVSLMLSIQPWLSPSEVMDIIRNTADDEVGTAQKDPPGKDKNYGYGRLNAYEALKQVNTFMFGEISRIEDRVNIYPNILETDNLNVEIKLDDTFQGRNVQIYVQAIDGRIFSYRELYIKGESLYHDLTGLHEGFYQFVLSFDNKVIMKPIVVTN